MASMASPHNEGIFTHNDGSVTAESISEVYQPSGSQALIKVKFSAVNPADIRHAYMGMYKTSSVTGYEWLGTVIKKGSDCSFEIGEEVFGISMPAFSGSPRALSSGAHQDFMLAER